MEDINKTMNRVNQIWLKADDKEVIAQSFGFETVEAFVGLVLSMYEGPFQNEIAIYVDRLMKEDGRSFEEVAKNAMVFAIADVAMVFMMMGRERERLDRNAADKA